MANRRSAIGYGAALAALACLAQLVDAHASVPKGRGEPAAGLSARAEAEFTRFIRTTSSARSVILATRPAAGNSRAAGTGTRGDKPVITATAPGAGQAGFVHFFLIRDPDDVVEVQVGIELPDQRIAWSFPELGVVVSQFVESGVVAARGKDYEVWHLYGIRPFPNDAAMAVLAKELAGRIRPWVEAQTPYCLNDGPRSQCMSCLGFVLRALFPGRGSDYPGLPRDFRRAGAGSKYTTNDLLLYLAGMLDLPTREARLRRIAGMTLPDDLREDLERLVHSMGATEAAPAASAASPHAPGIRPPKVSTRPVQRRGL